MTRPKAQIINIAATVLGLTLLLGSAGRLKAFFLSSSEKPAPTLMAQADEHQPSAAEHPAETSALGCRTPG
jgi:hypothetical protein